MTKTDEYLWITEKLILLSYYFEIEGALFSYVQKKKEKKKEERTKTEKTEQAVITFSSLK